MQFTSVLLWDFSEKARALDAFVPTNAPRLRSGPGAAT
jgi:hypothetical protein